MSSFQKKIQSHLPQNFAAKLIVVLLLVFCVVLIFVNLRIYNKRRHLNSQIESLKNKIEETRNTNNNLKQEILKADDDKYIEKIAREELDLQKPGEKVFSFIDKSPQDAKETESSKNIFQVWLDNIFNFMKNSF